MASRAIEKTKRPESTHEGAGSTPPEGFEGQYRQRKKARKALEDGRSSPAGQQVAQGGLEEPEDQGVGGAVQPVARVGQEQSQAYCQRSGDQTKSRSITSRDKAAESRPQLIQDWLRQLKPPDDHPNGAQPAINEKESE